MSTTIDLHWITKVEIEDAVRDPALNSSYTIRKIRLFSGEGEQCCINVFIQRDSALDQEIRAACAKKE